MARQTNRNDLCPCGSGKTFKQCCGHPAKMAAETTATGHEHAVGRAIDWLMTKHRKAMMEALEAELFGALSDEDAKALQALDPETLQGIEINIMEWLLAEGEILVRGKPKRVAACLLGPGGPVFTADERAFIIQLTTQPLRLYVVTDVSPGRQITLCDALDGRKRPITVQEKAGSQTLQAGTYLGCRVLNLADHFKLSGSVLAFSPFMGPEAVAMLKQARKEFKDTPEELGSLLGMMLQRIWLDQFISPMPMPTLIDAYSGDLILLVTDHYQVEDWDKLAKVMARQKDVEGDPLSGWVRFLDCEDGERRTLVDMQVDVAAHRLSLLYKTRNYAEKGRIWFDKLAGKTVTYLIQDVSDPTSAPKTGKTGRQTTRQPQPDDFPPELVAKAAAQLMHRLYANWADEPMPALNGKTPRQALKTPTGTERVKGLIRSYEAAEKKQAAQQGRDIVSFDFLWDQIGLKP